jgi:hypothetical protein
MKRHCLMIGALFIGGDGDAAQELDVDHDQLRIQDVQQLGLMRPGGEFVANICRPISRRPLLR